MAVITSAGSGAWNSTTPNAPWPSGTVPGSADNVTIATGHTVTTTATMAAIDLTINGIFQWSRSVSATLTLQRNFTVNNSGTWDMGTDASPIPSGVNHTVILNNENSAVDAQRLSAFLNACGATFVGVTRTRNAKLTAEAASGQPVIIVNDATGWASGDQLVILGNTTASSTNQVTTISSISGTTITLAANLAEIKRIDTAVGNFSSNLVFRSNQANAGAIRFLVNGGSASGQAQYIKNVLFLDGGISSAALHPSARAALGTINSLTYQPLQTIESCAFFRTASGTQDAINLAIAQARRITSRVANCAIYSPTATGLYIADSVTDLTVENTSIYQAGLNLSMFMGFSAGCFGAKFKNGLIKSSGHSSLTPGANLLFEGVNFISDTSIFSPVAAGRVELKSCVFNKIGSYDLPGSGQGLLNIDAGSVGDFQVSDASFGASITHVALSSLATGPRPVFGLKDLTTYKSFNNAGGREVDTSIVNLGANSLRLSPVSTTNKLIQDISITIPTVTLKVAGVLRKNSTYGASNRPFVQISGSTISTQTFTMTDSTDTWESFVLSATASGAGTVVFRVQAENSNVASRAYLADLQIRAFGYEQASLPLLNPTIDIVTSLVVPTITSGDATSAAAITGIAINFSTSTITVSSARTIEQLINYHEVQWSGTLGANRLFTANNLSTITTAANLSLGATLTGNVTTTGNIAITVAGNYSSTKATLASSSTLTVANGTTTLRGWVFASGATVSGSGSAIVEVDANQIANITASGGVIVRSIPVIFSGFPTGNNVNAVPFSSVIAIRNTSDSTLFTASASSGSVAVSLSTIGNGVGPFSVWGDGRGVRRTIEQSITVNRADDVSFSGLFEEFVNESGQVLVGLAAADSGITYDAGNTRFLFASASSTFLAALHQFDLLTSTEAGQAYNNEAIRGIRFVQNAFVRTIFLPSPFTIAATADAPTARTLVDCRIIRPDGSDARAYGLASTVYAGDRPIVSFPFAVQEYVGLTAQAARDSLKLAPSAGSPAAGSVDADLDTLVARNNPLDAAGTRSAVGMGSANLDTQLGTIDTVVDAILVDTDATLPAQITARTLVAADYFDPATDTVANVTTVSTVTNKSGYSLTTPPLDSTATQAAAAAALNAYDPPTRAELTSDVGTVTGAIADVPTVAEFEARTIPAADYFVVSDYTAPANSDITAIKAKTDNLPSDPADQSQVEAAITAATSGLATSSLLSALTTTVGTAGAGLTNIPKTGYSLSAGGIQAIWDALTSALTTSGSVGKRIADFLNASVAAIPTADNSANITAIKAKTDSLTFTTANRVDSTAITVSDKTGYALSGTQAFNLTGNVTGSLSGSVGSVTGNVGGTVATVTTLTNLPTIPNNWITAAGIATDAIGADELAASAITKIQSGLATTSQLNSIQGAGFNTATDSLEALRDRGDSAWVTANISGLATATALTTLGAAVDLIKNKTDSLTFTGSDVRATLDGETVAVGDKTGFSLTSGERTAIATAVEAALINEGDGQQLINAILQVINSNLDLPALELTAIAQAVRSELATELGRIDAAITTRLATAGYTAPDNSGITTLQTRLSSLRAGYLDKLDVSGTLAHTNNASTFKADTAPVLTAIALIPTNPLLASGYTAPDNSSIGLIKAKTDSLPTDPADQSQVEAAITSATSGLSTLTAAQVWVYSGGDRSLSGAQATAITSAATLAQVQAAGFTTDRHNALIAAEAAAKAVASGRHKINYAASTATQYNADGSVRTVFDLVDADGDPATSGASAVERVPR